jgi:hypothetical protein
MKKIFTILGALVTGGLSMVICSGVTVAEATRIAN